MTLFVGQPFSGAGTPITLNGDDQYFLAPGITVHSTNTYALTATGSNNVIDIEGTLTGFSGLRYSAGTSVNIASNGIVMGSARGIDCDFGATTLVNHGLVVGGAEGIRVEFQTNAAVTNHGRIIAGGPAISVLLDPFLSSSNSIKLQNFGTITSTGGTSLAAQGAADSVTNKGLMNGNVNLGGGTDTYDGNGGRVKGWIWGEAGNDTLSGGSSADLFYGGVGDDRITGRGGRDDLWGDDTATPAVNAGKDTFDFNAISESGTTASTRDIIRDFNNGDDRIDLSTIDANTTVAGNQSFTVLTKGTATSAVGTGKIGWYWIDAAGTANDRTIIRINNDADSAADMTIELVGLKTLSRTAGVDFVL